MRILLASLLLLSGFVAAETKQITRDTIGFGATRKEAIAQGLIEAVSQVKGVKIDAVQQSKSALIEVFEATNGEETDHSSVKAVQNAEISKATKGAVDSYEVISVRRVDSGYEAHLKVHLSEYRVPGVSNTKRRKLAVMPFRTTDSAYQLGNRSVASKEFEQSLNQSLVSALTQTRRFAVVDRSFLDEYQAEKAQILSGNLPVNEQAKLGQALGVDYMVVGIIDEASAQTKSTGVALTGERRQQLKAEAKVDYRVIAMASRQVKWSATSTISLALPYETSTADIKRNIAEKAAQQITVELLENIYPIRVLTRENSKLVLNQGGNTLKPGMLMDVFNPGKKLIDPYTKESLGHEEILVAQVRVDRVISKQSYASVIAGEPEEISDKAILRQVKEEKAKGGAENPLHRKAQTKTLSGGGVNLGF